MTTIHWIAASGNWNAPDNWSTSTVPGPLDDAVLDATGTYTVTSSSNVTVNSLSGNSGATLDITAGVFTVNNFGAQGPLILSGGLLRARQKTTESMFGPIEGFPRPRR
jgi:hypothetical protein